MGLRSLHVVGLALLCVLHSCQGASQCPSSFDNIPAQQDFDEKKFAGKWFTQLKTSYAFGSSEWQSGVQDFVEVQEIGVYDMTYTAFSTQEHTCKVVNYPRMLMVKRLGNYIYNAAFSEFHLLVVYTNYEHALVVQCFGKLDNHGQCLHGQTRYAIWSRNIDVPTKRVMNHMKQISEEKLCVTFSDFHEIAQGLCNIKPEEELVHVDETRCPPRPGHIVAEHHSTEIDITWSSSNDVSVIVRGYHVSIGTDINHMTTHDVGPEIFHYKFEHLTPDTHYLVKVQGFNNHGQGTSIYKHIRTDALVVGKCNLDQLTIQENFDLDRFMGVWHLRRETTFLGDGHIWKSLTMRLSHDDQGVLHMAYAGTLDHVCVHVQDARYNEIQPGFYEHHTGTQDSFIKIHYTDYHYAVVDICLGSTYDRHCNRTEEEVEIWSHDDEAIPTAVEAKLKTIIENDLCVNYDEMVETTPGMCALPAPHKDSDCLLENIEVQQGFDKAQFSGIWYNRFSTHYLPNANIHSTTLKYGVDENGELHMSFSGVINGVCTNVHDVKLDEVQPGFYSHPGKVPYFSKIVYTDYKYALVEWCMNGNETHCVMKEVEIWSRTTDDIPALMEASLEDMASSNLCVPPKDLVELTLSECAEPVLTYGKCDLDNLEIQDHFDLDRFLGIWHLREETHFLENDKMWKSLTMRLTKDSNGVLHMAYAGMIDDTCIHVQDAQYGEIQPGYYEHHTGLQDSFMKIHYTDYNYAIVDICLGSTYDRHCNQSQEEVEIWSRTNDPIPPDEEALLRTIVTGNLCIKESDLVDATPGMCALPAPHKDSDCLLKNVEVQENFDINQFSGRWFSKVSSRYWESTIIHSETRIFGVDSSGVVHMSESEFVNDVCVTLNDVTLTEIQPGYYKHEAHSTYYMKVHYTDYHYAIVEMCYGDDHMTCAQKQVEIWSRDHENIPVITETALEDMVSGNLCVPPNELHNLVTAECEDPVLAIGSRCNLDRIKTQADFQIKMFLGRWYSRYAINYSGRTETLIHLKRTFSLDENGVLHAVLLGETDSRCLHMQDIKLYDQGDGVYFRPPTSDDQDTGYIRVHFTDYTYAILDICFGNYTDHHCDRSQEQVEILSRHQDDIPEQMLNLLDNILDSNMCIKLDDMKHLNPVDCFTPGTDYYGPHNTTENGRACQRWDAATPHKHSYGDYYLAMDNYCRTFDHPVPWCFTTESTHRWENCSVPLCRDCDGNTLQGEHTRCEYVHAQAHFNESKFEGLWHMVSATTYNWQGSVYTSSSLRIKFDENGTMHSASASLESGATDCTKISEYKSYRVKPGVYSHTNGLHTFVEVSYTDYEYAIVYSCFGEDPSDHRCKKGHESISVWSRHTTPIPENERHHLRGIVSRDYCIPLSDLHDMVQGSCEVPEINLGKCDLDNLSIQEHFNLTAFLGEWHLRSDTRLIANDMPWKSLTTRWSVDSKGQLHVAYGGILELDTCIQVKDTLYTQLSAPGHYKHHTEAENSYIKIHYTDYHFAVVDICFGKSDEHHCDKTSEEVQILSRTTDPIPETRMHLLKAVATGDLCINFDDFVEVTPGQCQVPPPHIPGDCTIDHISVQENFNIKQFNGFWHSRLSTLYGDLKNVHSEFWKFGQDSNDVEYVSLSETINTTCHYLNDMQLTEIVPGVYEHSGAKTFFLKVHFTDYEYAVVEMCDGGTSSTCVHKQVEIWSRTMDAIPLHMKVSLEEVVSGNLCIPVDDLHELQAGNCNVPEISIPGVTSHKKESSWSLGSILRKIF